ncbi:pyridoxamine 5'-phosphate oxidase family protein [Streptomyces sp. ISL-111]|nr:pyridoxamine 5'-phosphate oxidase family protein [Streptomyces sp. ISL-111]
MSAPDGHCRDRRGHHLARPAGTREWDRCRRGPDPQDRRSTSASSDLVRAVDGTVVAFEADEVDTAAHSGWSVVVAGLASVVTDPDEHERLVRTGPRSWVPWPEVFVRIEPELVTGRELVGGRTLYGVNLPS